MDLKQAHPIVSVADFYAHVGGDVTSKLQVAIDYCIANSIETLYWPAGLYTTSASLNNFHALQHSGPGVIARGSDLFYISPQDDTENILYCAISGASAANDGLSASEPFDSIQGAVDALVTWGPYLKGTWTVQLSNETFSRFVMPLGLRSATSINIKGVDVGGHPNVPVTQITEGNGVTAAAIFIQKNTHVKISDILITGYNGSAGSSAINIYQWCRLDTVNVHVSDCVTGIIATAHSTVNVKGGIFYRCGYLADHTTAVSSVSAITGDFLTKFEVGLQGAGNLNSGPIIKNSVIGIYAAESVVGHLDWVTIQDCVTGVRLAISSRLNLDGTSVKRCGTGFWAQDNSVMSLSDNTLAGIGTGADKNSINFICNSGGTLGASSYYALASSSSAFSREYCVARSVLSQTINSTGYTSIASITLKGNLFIDGFSSFSQTKSVRARVYGTISGTNGSKSIVFRFGATGAQADFDAPDSGAFIAEGVCLIGTNPVGTQLLMTQGSINIQTGKHVRMIAPTEDLTTDTLWRIQGIVANASDSITVLGYEIWIDGL